MKLTPEQENLVIQAFTSVTQGTSPEDVTDDLTQKLRDLGPGSEWVVPW